MNETSKCHQMRLENRHFEKYLHGRGIDIGCGLDPLKPPHGTVEKWDLQEGDAKYLEGIPDNTFDFVYSSHCLEHLTDIPVALRNWRRVLKPTGILYFVVPDFLLYEKLCFPSRYNSDHKHTFSLTSHLIRAQVKRDNHWTLTELTPLLGYIFECGLNDRGYDYSAGNEDQTLGNAMAQLYFVSGK